MDCGVSGHHHPHPHHLVDCYFWLLRPSKSKMSGFVGAHYGR